MFLTYIYVQMKIFIQNKEAASAIEYAIVAAMVAVILISFISPIGLQVKASFNQILTALGGTAIK